MGHLAAEPDLDLRRRLERIGTSIRGKLQFMDYLVRAALADVNRYEAEQDSGTRIFLRQLIEMHASNLSNESEEMRVIEEFCSTLESTLADAARDEGGDPQ